MPYKDQTKCYRNINGQRYENACDVLDDRAERDVELCKAGKFRHRLIKHPDGYKQLFVHQEDMGKFFKTLGQENG